MEVRKKRTKEERMEGGSKGNSRKFDHYSVHYNQTFQVMNVHS